MGYRALCYGTKEWCTLHKILFWVVEHSQHLMFSYGQSVNFFCLQTKIGLYCTIQDNGPSCTRSGFGLQNMAEVWFFNFDQSAHFSCLQTKRMACIIPQTSALYLPTMDAA